MLQSPTSRAVNLDHLSDLEWENRGVHLGKGWDAWRNMAQTVFDIRDVADTEHDQWTSSILDMPNDDPLTAAQTFAVLGRRVLVLNPASSFLPAFDQGEELCNCNRSLLMPALEQVTYPLNDFQGVITSRTPVFRDADLKMLDEVFYVDFISIPEVCAEINDKGHFAPKDKHLIRAKMDAILTHAMDYDVIVIGKWGVHCKMSAARIANMWRSSVDRFPSLGEVVFAGKKR